MKRNYFRVASIFIIFILVLTSCNLPRQQSIATPNSSNNAQLQSSPTPTSLCANPLFPTIPGGTWEYSGTNSLVGAYTRTDTITGSGTDTFTQSVTEADVSYTIPYDCSTAGLTSRNPVQQYAGALLNSPNSPVSVKLNSNSGISLPTQVTPGDTWQQTTDWEATSSQINLNGRFVFDYTAVGYENLTVPGGTYNALHINGTIQVEITGLHVSVGTYTTSTWWAPNVGLVKSEGISHVSGIDFTDSMQLTQFTPSP